MKPIASDWTDVVLVCRKCAKQLKKGFGEDATTASPRRCVAPWPAARVASR